MHKRIVYQFYIFVGKEKNSMPAQVKILDIFILCRIFFEIIFYSYDRCFFNKNIFKIVCI